MCWPSSSSKTTEQSIPSNCDSISCARLVSVSSSGASFAIISRTRLCPASRASTLQSRLSPKPATLLINVNHDLVRAKHSLHADVPGQSTQFESVEQLKLRPRITALRDVILTPANTSLIGELCKPKCTMQ